MRLDRSIAIALQSDLHSILRAMLRSWIIRITHFHGLPRVAAPVKFRSHQLFMFQKAVIQPKATRATQVRFFLRALNGAERRSLEAVLIHKHRAGAGPRESWPLAACCTVSSGTDPAIRIDVIE